MLYVQWPVKLITWQVIGGHQHYTWVFHWVVFQYGDGHGGFGRGGAQSICSLRYLIFILMQNNDYIFYPFQFGRSQSYRVATTPLVDDGSAPKGKHGGKSGKKSKKAEKKENLEDLKKELEIVRINVQCCDVVLVRCHAEIMVLFCRTGIQSLWKRSVDVWRQLSRRLVQFLRVFFSFIQLEAVSMQCLKRKGCYTDAIASV